MRTLMYLKLFLPVPGCRVFSQLLTILLIVVRASIGQTPELIPQASGSHNPFNHQVVFGGRENWLAVASENGLIRIYDMASGRVARQINVKREINALKAHPSEDILGVLSEQHFIVLYDIQTGREIWRTETRLDCSAIWFSPDGTKLLSLYRETTTSLLHYPKSKFTIETWDTHTGVETQNEPVPTPEGILLITSLSSDGKWAGGIKMPNATKEILKGFVPYHQQSRQSGISAFESVVFDMQSGSKVGSVKGFLRALSTTAGTAITMTDNDLQLVDVSTGKQLATLSSSQSYALTTSDGKKFLLSSQDGIAIVDARTGQMRRLDAGGLPVSAGITLGPDDDQLALAQGGAVLLLKVSNPTERRMLGNPAAVMTAHQLTTEFSHQMEKFGGISMIPAIPAFIDSGRLLALRSADGWWDVWDVATGNRLPFRKPLGDAKKYEISGEHLEVLLDEQDLRDIEASLGGSSDNTRQTTPKSIEVKDFAACSSPNGEHILDVRRTDKEIKSAVLRSADGTAIDLLAAGVDLSALRFRSLQSFINRRDESQSLCSLSSDGAKLIVEGLRAELHNKQRNKLSRMFVPSPEDIYGKKTSDSLVVYDTNTGRKVCELENSVADASFDVLASELIFSPDGKRVIGGGDREKIAGYGVEHRNTRLWDLNTCKQLQNINANVASALGFSSDNAQFFTALTLPQPGQQNYGIRVWDSISGKSQFDIPDVLANNRLLTITPKGNVLIGPDRENALGIWDRRTGERLGTMRPFQEGEWLVTTPSGLFDGSPRGWSEIAWRDSNKSLTTKPAEIFFNEFYRPGLFAELLDGHRPQPPRTIAQVDRRQPKVEIAVDSQVTAQRMVTVRVFVEEITRSSNESAPSGVRDVRLFRNGTLVKAWRGDLALHNGKASFETKVAVTAGENRFVAYAFNHDNVKSADAVALVKSTDAPRLGTAYILAIGVNQYANPEFNLAFAVPDAKRLAEMLAQTQQELGKYNRVIKVNLLDDEATKVNILFALSRLSGRSQGKLPLGVPPQLMTLEAVEPEDTVVVYFAGHGTVSGDHFYLVPHDLGYSGPRNSLRDSLEKVLHSSISDSELEEAFEPVDAAHSLLIIDACSSGKALDSEEQRRGPMNSKGLAQLAYEKGMYVLTASQAYQAALESSRLGHGYLTFALAEEGLKTQLADTKPTDGKVTVPEWFEYAARRVPQLQIEAIQQASINGRSLAFEIDPRTDSPNKIGRLQTPRFYYRRDFTGTEAIVAKVH